MPEVIKKSDMAATKPSC